VLPAHSAGDLQRAQQHRRVPWNDGAHDAKRLPSRVAEHVLAERDRLALQFASEAAEVAEDVCRQPRFGPRPGAQRIAGLQRDGAGKLFAARFQRFGDAQQKTAAVAW
jgi:hypothetical protein